MCSPLIFYGLFSLALEAYWLPHTPPPTCLFFCTAVQQGGKLWWLPSLCDILAIPPSLFCRSRSVTREGKVYRTPCLQLSSSAYHFELALCKCPPACYKPYANDKTPACPDKITTINLISMLLIIVMVKWGFPICSHVAANLFSFITAARAMCQIALVSRRKECWLWVKLPAPHPWVSKIDLTVIRYRHSFQHMCI